MGGGSRAYGQKPNERWIYPGVQLDVESETIPPYSKGLIFWHPDQKTIASYGQFEGPILNHGEELWAVGTNKAGVDIRNGQVNYVSGASGNRPNYGLAKADSFATSAVIGVATHDIENNSQGVSDTFGLVRDVDTTGDLVGETWLDGQILFVSPTVAGEMTNVRPTYPNLIIPIALVLNAHKTQGVILVRAHFPLNFITPADIAAAPASSVSNHGTVADPLNLDFKISHHLLSGAVNQTWTISNSAPAYPEIEIQMVITAPLNISIPGTTGIAESSSISSFVGLIAGTYRFKWFRTPNDPVYTHMIEADRLRTT